MTHKPTIWILMSLFAILSCKTESHEDAMARQKAEILSAERAFAETVKKEGMKEGFLAFASEDAVLKRGNKLIKGKQAIADYFDKQTLQNVRLEWEPDFVDVSASGDLGYTYGPYEFEATNQAGEIIQDRGIFHTVWRKQADGSWRYVWD